MASYLPTIFKRSLLDLFPISSIKVALYTGAVPALDTITQYTTTNEVSGTGYTAGGQALSSGVGTSGTVAILDATDLSWAGASFSTTYAIIYATASINGQTNRILAVIDFGGTKTVAGGTFTLDFPASGAATSFIQVA